MATVDLDRIERRAAVFFDEGKPVIGYGELTNLISSLREINDQIDQIDQMHFGAMNTMMQRSKDGEDVREISGYLSALTDVARLLTQQLQHDR